MRSYALVTAAALLLPGCAAIRGPSSTEWPWAAKAPCANMSACNAGDALAAYNAASSFCRSVQNYYESGGRRSDASQFLVGAVGTVAGTVIAPIAKGDAAKGWAGLSGAANGIQLSMEETFSNSLSIKRRVAVKDATDRVETTYQAATDPLKKVELAIAMARSCAVASAAADEKALKAITE